MDEPKHVIDIGRDKPPAAGMEIQPDDHLRAGVGVPRSVRETGAPLDVFLMTPDNQLVALWRTSSN